MSLKYSFDADIEDIYNLLTDPQFLVDRNVAMGDLDSECEAGEADADLLIKMSRTRALNMPAVMANVLGGSQVFDTEEVWQVVDDHYEGSSTTVLQGQSGTVHTEFSLIPTEQGCEYSINHKAKVKIPVVGRKVAKFIEKTAGEDVAKEIEYLRSELS